VKGLRVSVVNQVWAGDLTYLRTEEGFMFLALLTDMKSRHIVGHHLGDSLESIGCQMALQMALKRLPKNVGTIHHTDRGSQYCCHPYVELALGGGRGDEHDRSRSLCQLADHPVEPLRGRLSQVTSANAEGDKFKPGLAPLTPSPLPALGMEQCERGAGRGRAALRRGLGCALLPLDR
jgi:hypothetical protein